MQNAWNSIKWRIERALPAPIYDRLKLLATVRYQSGLQSFLYTKENVFPINAYVRKKHDLVYCEMAKLVKGKTVLDIGCSYGYFTNLARTLGARRVLGIEGEKEPFAKANRIAEFVGLDGVDFTKGYFPEINPGIHDVTLAFAVSHWAYQYWPGNPYWPDIIRLFGEVTREHLFIEYIDKEDPVFEENSPRKDFDQYEIDHFLSALDSHFDKVQPLGFVKSTRRIFLAAK